MRQNEDSRPLADRYQGTALGDFLNEYQATNGFTQQWKCEHCGHLNRHSMINCERCEAFPREAA